MNLSGFFTPQTIAVVGATDRRHAPGGRVLRYLLQHGFGGTIYPVNPNREQVAGLRAYPDREALPEDPDLTILAIPIARAIDHIDIVVGHGDRDFVVFAAARPDERAALADRIARHDLRLLGPNCVGFFNIADAVPASFSSAGEVPSFARGGLAMVGQSGGVISALLNRAADRGLGLSSVIATGDELGIRSHDALHALAADGVTETALLYIESFSEGRNFIEAARAFTRTGKRLIVLRGGVSPTGRMAASTHTGGLAGDERVSGAVLREIGAIRADSLTMGLDIAELAASRRIRRLARVPRIGVIGGSGGGSVLLSDAAHRAGVELAQLRPASVSALEEILPVFASAVNPLDVTAGVLERPEVLGRAAEIVAQDPEVELTVCVGLATSETTADGIAQGARQIAAHGLPVIIARESGSLSAEALAGGRSLGVPVVDGFDGAMLALARLAGRPTPVEIQQVDCLPRLPDAIAHRHGPAGELESLGILAAAGVAVPRSWELTGDLDESELPFPLVVKASAPEIFHKRQHGLISTGVADVATLRREAARIRARVEELGIPDATVFAQETAPPGWEFFIGLTVDEGFGPIVVVGLGGSLVERIDVTSTARAAAAYSAPERLVDELRLPSGLFSSDELSALASAVRAVAGLALDERIPLREVDVNPVLLTASSTIAVDAKLVFAAEGALVGRG